ncbi:MAG TPA: hypothetical protein VNA16_03765 [Abditibacteriaceae bacterium]|nr:hypothetical protein [Abditibacteriaceae bacterium]
MSQENTSTTSTASAPTGGGFNADGGVDLQWVWREVRKRVFIKLPFSMGLADAMEAVVPIALDDDNFICGLSSRDYPLSSQLMADQVKNTIENILRQASGRYMRFEIIEGTALEDWTEIRDRRKKAQAAVIAMAEKGVEAHHFEDLLNQIVGEIRRRVSVARDKALPQVRAHLLLEIVPSLVDAEEMLFPDRDAHEARRAMARAMDRIAGFLDVTPLVLALEVERWRRDHFQPRQHAAEDSKASEEESPQTAEQAAEPLQNPAS